MFLLYYLVLFLLVIYSYSQVDLNLTLSSNSYYLFFQNSLTNLGYFNRSLSSILYLLIVCLLFIFYILLFKKVRSGQINRKNVLFILIVSSLILLFSYPAFSHDFFNYMFDARIVTKYHLNPYYFKALDFPDDTWTRFMHWTHRTYPYGPMWLITTLPFSILGFGKFVITLFNFKVMFLLFHLGNIYLIYKILKNKYFNSALTGVVLYGFNPLIQIESLASPHNEVVMLFFLLLSIYFFFIKRNKILGLFVCLLSIGTKFITAFLVPVFFLRFIKTKIDESTLFFLMFILLIIGVIVEIIFREAYAWYFILPIGVGILSGKEVINKLIITVSIASLLRYLPFLYFGDYGRDGIFFENLLFLLPFVIVLFIESKNVIINALWKY